MVSEFGKWIPHDLAVVVSCRLPLRDTAGCSQLARARIYCGAFCVCAERRYGKCRAIIRNYVDKYATSAMMTTIAALAQTIITTAVHRRIVTPRLSAANCKLARSQELRAVLRCKRDCEVALSVQLGAEIMRDAAVTSGRSRKLACGQIGIVLRLYKLGDTP